MAKRSNGEGTIIKRKDGRFQGSIAVGRDIFGKAKRKTVYGKTEKEVQVKLTEVAHQLNNSNYLEPSCITLEVWLKDWLENYKSISLKPTTYDLYENIINTIINKEIGKLKLKDIKPMNIQAFYFKLYNKGNGYATSTIQKVNNILNPAFEVAIKNELIAKNPAIGVELPRHSEKQVRSMTHEEQKTFIEFAQNNRYYAAFIVAMDTGLRLGELLALTWDDIDFEKEEISVTKNVVSVADRNSKDNKLKLLVQDTPKTTKSVRKIPMTDRVMMLLKQLKVKQQKKSRVVFCTRNGTHVYPRNLRRAFQCILKRAEIEQLGIHVLRHNFATNCFELGMSPKIVQELLGHANVSITLDTYTHVLPSQKKEAIRLLNLMTL